MPTTIQLDEETVKMLKGYKEQLNIPTYDDLIRKILAEKTKKSMFGCLGKRKSMKEILNGLRDEDDRL